MLPDSDNLITFDINGEANIIVLHYLIDLSPHKVNYRKVFKGEALLMVQATDRGGDITITATSEGLESYTVNIISNEKCN